MSRSENIHVSLRFRPLNTREIDDYESSIWNISKNSVSIKPEYAQILLESKRLTRPPKGYTYNHCFAPRDSNQFVYDAIGKRVVLASLEGYNGTIFAYGQTGSGKTFTMMGADEDENEVNEERKILNATPSLKKDRRSVSPLFRPSSSFQKTTPAPPAIIPVGIKDKGIISLALDDLFANIKKFPEKTYFLTCSYLEIYNEQVFDLLSESAQFKGDILSINEDPTKGFYVKGLSEHVINSIEEVKSFLEKGESNRKYAATAMNHHSSRSHTIFRLNVTSVTVLENFENDENGNSITTESVLNFVDLAGSERVSNLQQDVSSDNLKKKAKNSLDTLVTEGKHINTSLFYLCQVIHRLSEKDTIKSETHIPYRNSNLTKILRSSLGGNSLTCIICTATPTLSQFEMTLSTLRFGGIAKTITNKVEANVTSNKNAELLQAYQHDIEQLKKDLEIAQQGGKAKIDEAIQAKKQLEERISKLIQMLLNQSRNNIQKPVSGISQPSSRDLWCKQVGELIIDFRLENHDYLNKINESETNQLRFDDKGSMAMERMKSMHIELKNKDTQIQELKDCKQALIDSKANLKNDLKKALTLCKELSDKKQAYKVKCKKLHKHNKNLEQRLNLIEKQIGLEKLSSEQLQQLEAFFFHSLDAVKNARFRKKYENKLSLITHQESTIAESPVHRVNGRLFCHFGGEDLTSSGSDSESSLEFETSFYKNKKFGERSFAASFNSQDISALMLGSLIENDYEDSPKKDLSKVDVNVGLRKEPLLEIPQNSEKWL
ncbi:unnamed protein product [Blepharisma stoltei]|uniref:Kinesin-like protein n=1 Tax=Blepharisma stoltei TaxID=1481888 RepID=A0AAU9IB32_9CILI|nr:unnamed protein product [Blepharisma stoltei]